MDFKYGTIRSYEFAEFFFFSHFARALLASNGGGPVKLRVLPEGGMEVDDLPGASLLEVPPTGGIDAKECLMVNQLDGSFCEVSCRWQDLWTLAILEISSKWS